MEETATRELDTQALEQILIGHMMAVCGEANQIFRPVTMLDDGIDGEVEFKTTTVGRAARRSTSSLRAAIHISGRARAMAAKSSK
jgi:hypothetical protein